MSKMNTRSSFDIDREFDALLETEAVLPYKLTMLCVVATDTEANKQPITILVNFDKRSVTMNLIRQRLFYFT